MASQLVAVAASIAALSLASAAGDVSAATAAVRASAAPTPTATATSSIELGMRYAGGDGSNRVTVVIAPGDRFLVSDMVPITAGAGCTPTNVPVVGLHAVTCLAPRLSSGQFRRFRIDTAGGDDVINNSSPAGMSANGGEGNDTLNGGISFDNLVGGRGRDILRGNGGSDSLSTESVAAEDRLLADILEGGDGDDDLRAGPGSDVLRGGDGQDVLRGGLGADSFDAGPGVGDVVTYSELDHDGVRVIASLDGNANDGVSGENDNVMSGVDILAGGSGPDILSGNADANQLVGNRGDDALIGFMGADQLVGGLGNDSLYSNRFAGVPVEDGAIDILDGSTAEFDHCRIPFPVVEADVTISCESIDQD